VPARPSSVSPLLQYLPLTRQVTGDGQARLHGREQLGLLLHHLREASLHQAVEDFIDFLPRYVRARGQFQRLELGMAQQHQIRTRLISIEPKLL